MHTLRFLVSRRWITFALVVVFLAWVAWRLGEWQFHRLDDRRERNAIIERNEKAGPAPVADVMAPGRAVPEASEWRIVEATGTYAVDDTVIVRYRTRDGEAGVDVVVPLELADGTSLLVDRGWYATTNRGATTADVPAPPSGEVTVTGWVRRDAEGDSTEVSGRSTRAVNSEAIADALDREVVGGWVDLRTESPAPAEALVPVELPELNNGPHFFYGLQWWFFGALAVFGFFYLVYDEVRGGRGPQRPAPKRPATRPAVPRRKTWRERLDSASEDDDPEPASEPASEAPQQPAVDGKHHARQE
ncbi:SURF1 family protein [Nocardioides KLBMP 9356]|uniref:SURF1-like protein n=1 Tax=Nocardioides potassii TaxID=2911371 RepID=A0ABS9HFX8_9ACTN|nr:SURF1 family protein [Nocardioides potassii]MCF6379464.1 SURF1 family protein [Nocardioides potassii]